MKRISIFDRDLFFTFLRLREGYRAGPRAGLRFQRRPNVGFGIATWQIPGVSCDLNHNLAVRQGYPLWADGCGWNIKRIAPTRPGRPRALE